MKSKSIKFKTAKSLLGKTFLHASACRHAVRTISSEHINFMCFGLACSLWGFSNIKLKPSLLIVRTNGLLPFGTVGYSDVPAYSQIILRSINRRGLTFPPTLMEGLATHVLSQYFLEFGI